ncbi:hypothetical protein J6590_071058 [Homalodisca vitripennis]|nr:hypothetical protein J6590_071058 [Homalodisca vitripennis]
MVSAILKAAIQNYSSQFGSLKAEVAGLKKQLIVVNKGVAQRADELEQYRLLAVDTDRVVLELFRNYSSQFESLKAEVAGLKEQLIVVNKGVAQRADELEQYRLLAVDTDRVEQLIVVNRGVALRADELEQYRLLAVDTDNVLLELFRTNLDVDLSLADLDRSRCSVLLGPAQPIPIIVQFANYCDVQSRATERVTSGL